MNLPRIVAKSLVYNGWYKLYRLELDMPDGLRVERHLIDNGPSVAVLPYDPVRRTCILVSQPRAPVLEMNSPQILEVIAGDLGDACPEAQAKTEAREEAGLHLSALEPVSNVWSWAPASTERIQLYLAPYSLADRVGIGGGEDENECISVHEIELNELRNLVLSGNLTDSKSLILAQALLLKHPELWP